MAKVSIKFESITPFGGIYPIMDKFDRTLGGLIDSELGIRSPKNGYQYSEIIRSLMSVFLCGGSAVEDVTKHLKFFMDQHPKLRTSCSSDTILRSIKELSEDDVIYASKQTGKEYHFNISDKLNRCR